MRGPGWWRRTTPGQRLAERRERRELATREGVANLRGYLTPVQVCPRGCEFREIARRDLVLRTRLWGRVDTGANFVFETRHCPKCGAALARQCARCEEDILAPVVDLCRSCGLPQPWAAERRAGTDRASIRLWRPETKAERKKREKTNAKSLVNDPARLLYRSEDPPKKSKKKKDERVRGDLWVIDGDIVSLEVDAVVSNDDVEGQMWSQTARSIKKAAGEGVERLAQEGKPFQLGHAWVTTAGNLQQMKGIIHVASTSRHGKATIETVQKSLMAALRLASKEEYRSIAVTAIGTGPAGIDLEKWFEVFTKTTVSFLSGDGRPKGNPPSLSVILVLFDRHEFEEYVDTLRRMTHEAWVELGEPADGTPEWAVGSQGPLQVG
jgi:O-acetyl-ADP-ribose deacetylase (regulator of RNase III)